MSSSTRKRRRRSRGRSRSKLLLGLGVIATALGIGGLIAAGWVLSVAASAPPLATLKPRDPGGFSLVYSKDNQRLGVIQASELRKAIPNSQIPQTMKDATVAIEDERFYRHNGVDYLSIVRAGVRNAEAGTEVEGGSTITQQLVRLLYIGRERTYQRKIREAKLALELENQHSKEWILNQYINNVPYGTYGGQSAIGVWAAAKIYFNKAPQDLKLPEAALLAGLPQAPTRYSPVRSPAAGKARRDQVLRAMARSGYITKQEANEAIDTELELDMSDYFQKRREGFFFDYVQDQLYASFPRREVKRGGLRVYTTIDLKKQEQARSAIQGRLAGVGPSSAIVSVDPDNGRIETMASSADYGKSKFNLAAQGTRQPGSAFKTMTLLAALNSGISPNKTYTSKPLNFVDPRYGPIKTKTYANTYSGSQSLTRATLTSDNTVYMQLALEIGPDKVAETAKQMGIESKLNGFPAETLGGLTDGVSPLEMATAYATLASGGVYSRPRAITKIRTADGEELSGKRLPSGMRPYSKRRFDASVVSQVTKILQQNVTSGTGTKAQIGCPAAGKTGTTDEFSDGWFVGYTPNLSTAVWVGYPNASVRMYSEYAGGPVAGGTFPAEIWGDYMRQAKRGCPSFGAPSGSSKIDEPIPYDESDGDSSVPAPATTAPGEAAPESSPEPEAANARSTPEDASPATTPQGGNTGGQGYDPGLYESRPQDP